jgi:hypothetical protein
MPTPIPARASKTQSYVDTTDVDDVPDSYFNPRIPSSAIRRDTQGNQVIRRGNRQFVLHNTPPPQRKVHWSLILGIGMALMLGLYLGLTWVANWWVNHQLDATYGMPRTYQIDAIVYPGDSIEHPSHYIFLNLAGTVQVIEFPHGDSSHARIYKGPALLSDTPALVPVTGEFRNVNGKIEMLIHVQNQTIVYVNDGTQFKPTS